MQGCAFSQYDLNLEMDSMHLIGRNRAMDAMEYIFLSPANPFSKGWQREISLGRFEIQKQEAAAQH